MYCLAALKAYPSATVARARIGYLDANKLSPALSVSRADEPALEAWLHEFSREYFNDAIYSARPNKWCSRCWFRKSNGGPCAHA
jgi:hypothetical protein